MVVVGGGVIPHHPVCGKRDGVGTPGVTKPFFPNIWFLNLHLVVVVVVVVWHLAFCIGIGMWRLT